MTANRLAWSGRSAGSTSVFSDGAVDCPTEHIIARLQALLQLFGLSELQKTPLQMVVIVLMRSLGVVSLSKQGIHRRLGNGLSVTEVDMRAGIW